MYPVVLISDLGQYLRCPRIVYYQLLRTGNEERRILKADHLVLRHLITSFDVDAEDTITNESQLNSFLSDSLDLLETELPIIHRDEINLTDLSQAVLTLRSVLPGLASTLFKYREHLLPCEVDVELRSLKLGLSGRLDRLVKKDRLIPSIIRYGNPPSDGVWKRDRTTLAGYSLLVEDVTGRNVDMAQVEYPLAGEVRRIAIRSYDRAKALRIRNRIRFIKDGHLPDKPENAPCETCSFQDSCSPRRSLASRFF